jgi:hypothetical protein
MSGGAGLSHRLEQDGQSPQQRLRGDAARQPRFSVKIPVKPFSAFHSQAHFPPVSSDIIL